MARRKRRRFDVPRVDADRTWTGDDIDALGRERKRTQPTGDVLRATFAPADNPGVGSLTVNMDYGEKSAEAERRRRLAAAGMRAYSDDPTEEDLPAVSDGVRRRPHPGGPLDKLQRDAKFYQYLRENKEYRDQAIATLVDEGASSREARERVDAQLRAEMAEREAVEADERRIDANVQQTQSARDALGGLTDEFDTGGEELSVEDDIYLNVGRGERVEGDQAPGSDVRLDDRATAALNQQAAVKRYNARRVRLQKMLDRRRNTYQALKEDDASTEDLEAARAKIEQTRKQLDELASDAPELSDEQREILQAIQDGTYKTERGQVGEIRKYGSPRDDALKKAKEVRVANQKGFEAAREVQKLEGLLKSLKKYGSSDAPSVVKRYEAQLVQARKRLANLARDVPELTDEEKQILQEVSEGTYQHTPDTTVAPEGAQQLQTDRTQPRLGPRAETAATRFQQLRRATARWDAQYNSRKRSILMSIDPKDYGIDGFREDGQESPAELDAMRRVETLQRAVQQGKVHPDQAKDEIMQILMDQVSGKRGAAEAAAAEQERVAAVRQRLEYIGEDIEDARAAVELAREAYQDLEMDPNAFDELDEARKAVRDARKQLSDLIGKRQALRQELRGEQDAPGEAGREDEQDPPEEVPEIPGVTMTPAVKAVAKALMQGGAGELPADWDELDADEKKAVAQWAKRKGLL